MRADLEGMHDTQAAGAPVVPPRPDLGDPRLVGPPHALGTDFYRAPARRSRAAGAVAIALAMLVLAGTALTPIVHAWESTRHSDEFTFMATVGGRPIRWNPCQPIHYVVDLGAAPQGSLQDVQTAVLDVSDATGITFVYDGLTDEVPSAHRASFQPARYGDRWAPVLIGWVDPETSTFNFDPNGREAAGIAGPLTPDPGPQDIYVSGVVAINVADPNPPGFAEPGDQGPVVLHELGHVMGLGHAKQDGELMQPSGGGVTGFGPGDLEGLRELGRQAGCLPTPPVPSG